MSISSLLQHAVAGIGVPALHEAHIMIIGRDHRYTSMFNVNSSLVSIEAQGNHGKRCVEA